VPPWDYDAPAESRRLVDTSAAAIAACGLLRLASVARDAARSRRYRTAALRTVETLCREHVARDDPGWEGILKHGVYHLHKKLGVDESVMWGEYFFVEALDRALRA
jgi:unsaturated chondroitin disaccharide hydrolase